MISLIMVHLWLCQMMYRMDFNGFKNHMNEESGRLKDKIFLNKKIKYFYLLLT